MISRQLGQVTKKTIGNTLRRKGLKYCSTRKVPLLKEAHVQGHLKFANEHLNDSKDDWEPGGGQMRPKSSALQSTTFRVWREKNAEYGHHPHRQARRWKHYALGL